MAGTGEGKTIRVAVIDDDREMIKLVELILEPRGVEILPAYGGLMGYALVKREKPDVVLLDIMMPDIDGYEVCRKIKLDPITRDIPVIFVSARSGQQHIEQGLSLGAQGYMTKPFNPAELARKVLALAR
jgi:CheY-like chemotaxis protein